MIIMNPFRYAETNRGWIDDAFVKLVSESGMKTQKNPIPKYSEYVNVVVIPGLAEEAERSLKNGILSALQKAKEKGSVIYPELIVWAWIEKNLTPLQPDPFYVFKIEIKYE